MRWVEEGQVVDVWLSGKWLRCVVVAAMGDTARVVNELHGVDTWARLDEMREVA
jgi:hypothetical protein